MGDFGVRVKTCVDKMKTLGEDITNEMMVKKVIRSLLPRWNNVAIIIEESKNLTTLTYDNLIGSLMNHEERLKDPTPYKFEYGEDKAFASKEDEANSSV